MSLKTYRAASIADALAQIKKDLGPDAVILHTRSFKRGGLLGFGGRRLVEITASSAVNVVHPLARKGKAPVMESAGAPRSGVRPSDSALRRAYGARAAVESEAQPTEAAPDPLGYPGAAHGHSQPASALAAAIASPPATRIDGFSPQTEGRCVVAAAPADRAAASSGLWDEIALIKRMVGQVLHASKGSAQPGMPEALFQRYLRLLESEIAAEIADEIIGAVRDELSAEELADEHVVHQTVLRRLASYMPVAADAPRPGKAPDGRPLTVALVGPTGVGKTTTIAKLAATYKLRHARNVGLITCDTYRIAAVEQLRTYADIIGLPLKVALTPNEMAGACQSLTSCDVILIDTAGRSQHDGSRIADLAAFLDAARPHETHLVLSGATSESVLKNAAAGFSAARPNRIIFTKLDEVVNYGVIFNAARSIGAALSFVTTGQEVPDHIEQGRPDRLARLVLEGGQVR